MKIFPYLYVKSLFTKKSDDTKQQNLSEFYYGRWEKLRGQKDTTDIKEKQLKSLQSLPYLGYGSTTEKSKGTILHKPEKSYSGATLFCSGHKPVVYLIDMDGTILHKWEITFKEVWPDSLTFYIYKEHKQFIRRARVYPNGDLLCVFEYIGLVKLDRHSDVIWKYTGINHHDIDIAQNKKIYSLGHSYQSVRFRYPDFPYEGRDDFILILTPDGKLLRTISIFEAFYNSNYNNFLNLINQPYFFHANTVDIIEKPVAHKTSIFKEGDVLVSLRNINTVAVIDIESGKVKWALNGMWNSQHQPEFLKNGNIMLFDNRGGNKKAFYKYNRSRIIEFNPFTQKLNWEYTGNDQKIFFSHWLGYNQRLPNGNTLITESTQGHIFEVTLDKEIVWEYYNTHRNGENNELIASVMGARRLDKQSLTFLRNNH